ncbi:MAG: hypothetical protein QM627_12885 [Luteolibacter sp.]
MFGDLIREACRWDTAAWMETFGKIEKKNGDLVTPICNVYQREISDIIQWCHEHNRPCRIVALKPRQKGSSTFSVAAGYRRLQAKRARGLIAGGAHFQGKNLFKILGTYASHDELDPKTCQVMDMEARFRNGSTMERITLANANAGRSGTYQVLIITEVAYLAEEGVANATNVLNGLLKCVPFEPDTIVIQESTAKGASGDFYETFQGAVTFEEFKAGKNGYIKVFAPWFVFEDSRRDPASEDIAGWESLTARETELAAKWKLDLEQVAWMRWAIRDECKGSFSRFEQDYPFDPETAFLKSGRGVFNAMGLKHQRELLRALNPQYGVFDKGRNGLIAWRPTDAEEARSVLWERPLPGRRYLICADTMTGADQTGGDDPDSHGVFVLRAGYLDPVTRRWVEPAVVARNMCYYDGERFGCWWNIDVLEEEIWRMAAYYGNCTIVPEMNADRGLVELLKLRDVATIYQREHFNQREGTLVNAYGWMTTPKTRPTIVENMARAIREAGKGKPGEGLEIRCPWALKQFENFVVKKSGKAEAAQGHHDDDVMALSIGLQTMEFATTYFPEERQEYLPPDLRGPMLPGGRMVVKSSYR